MSQTLGGRIQWARERQGLDQGELGAELGHNDGSTVSKWESGSRRPNLEGLVKLVGLLNVNAHWLLTGEGEPWALPGEADEVLRQVRALVNAPKSPSTSEDAVELIENVRSDPRQDPDKRQDAGG